MAANGPAPDPEAPEPPLPVPSVARAALPPVNPKLPPVPSVEGPLQIKVVYPTQNALVASRDSNFIFGSVGNGQAGLTINGTLVPVWPNGAFMGWVANPPVDAQYYDLVAYTATDTTRLRHPVRTRAALPPVPSTPATVIPVSPPESYVLGNDSLARAVSDTDQVIYGRPSPTGTYRWFLFPGTRVTVSAISDGMARVRLDGQQEAWISRTDLQRMAGTSAEPVKVSAPLTVDGSAEWVDFNIPVDTPPAYLVEEHDKALTLTLYNAEASSGLTVPTLSDSYVREIRMESASSRLSFRIELARAPYGYLALYRNGVMTLRIRRPPTAVDPQSPLRGMTIAVDAGHPPGGANGPTGLYEAVSTLAVANRVRDLLHSKGATVIMTRTNAAPLALGARPIMARRANVNALVSIHLNAFPDGINPFRATGTGTYYFHPHSQLLASVMQRSLVPELGLRDLGIFRENLALARPTWMPAVLAEGLFLIMPDQEAAIRTPEYQEAYARGIVAGLEQFFATFAQ